jgi:hypothetical protein
MCLLVILVVFFEFGFFFVKQLFDLQALRRIVVTVSIAR